MTMRVRVTTGSGTPSEFTLEGDEVLIGRAATSRIVLNDARVSRQHARLVRRDDAWWVEDLGARNRTLLNGAPVQQAERLHGGDRTRLRRLVWDHHRGRLPRRLRLGRAQRSRW